jgi:lysophospholipid acyltransferase (LPLAT)-like uncharacterized protein
LKKKFSDFLHLCLQYIIWFFIKILISTYKIEVRRKDYQQKAKDLAPNKAFIFAVWHEQVVAVMSGHAWSEPYLALSSRSRDGDYAAFVSEKLGFLAVRGSSKKRNKDKGGKEAIQEYILKMNQGISGGITVDGPKGPRQRCKSGVVLISMQTGSPILPVAGIANNFWEFRSWDRFKVPKPFSKIIMQYGAPIQVESDASPDRIIEICQLVEFELQNIERDILAEASK